jgi:hypothetical protein
MTTQEIDIVNSQISSIDAKIAELNTCINEIDTCGGATGAEIIQCLADRRAEMDAVVTSLTNFKTELQAKLAVLQAGWGSPRQTIVDGISTDFSGQYDYLLNNLLKDAEDQKVTFFTLYEQASTTFLKETVIRFFFRL